LTRQDSCGWTRLDSGGGGGDDDDDDDDDYDDDNNNNNNNNNTLQTHYTIFNLKRVESQFLHFTNKKNA
jgi:hypothetical protein